MFAGQIWKLEAYSYDKSEKWKVSFYDIFYFDAFLQSKMEIDPATQGDAGIYECHANNK